MAGGKLIVEVYEYTKGSSAVPSFEYIPCELSKCLSRGNKAPLKEIIEKGFETLPKKSRDLGKQQEVLQKLEEANIGRINVAYHAAGNVTDAYIELTNVVPVSIAYADARRIGDNKDDIILYGRYKLTDGNETTVLNDAQRLTLIYSNYADSRIEDEETENIEDIDVQKEIRLNITYLQA